MTLILVEFGIVIAGLAVTAILFYRIPVLPAANNYPPAVSSVSVIIPARNEEKNLALLLGDLYAQTFPAHEIICVDDASEDSTAQVALALGAKLISPGAKPEGWTGKTWACQNGADAAKGELLLFLDADVRLGRDGIRALLKAYSDAGCTISVQPFHITEKSYEQFSMIFNFVQIAANGIALPSPRSAGLFGPVILISRKDYIKAGGHKSTRTSVIEDMALGLQLKKTGLLFRLFIGNQHVSFRMYSGGLRSLIQGWVKNMAAGAAQTPAPMFVMVFLWIASLISVPLQFAKSAFTMNWIWLIVYSFLYVVWALILAAIARRIGRFKVWAFALYPLLMLVMLGVFLVSLFKNYSALR